MFTHRFTLARLVVPLTLLAAAVSPALADRLVLRNGSAIEGTIANRETLASTGMRSAGVAIFDPATQKYHRFTCAEVDFIVLQDGSAERFYTCNVEAESMGKSYASSGEVRLADARSRATSGMTQRGEIRADIGLAAFGVGLLVFGITNLIHGNDVNSISGVPDPTPDKTLRRLNLSILTCGALATTAGTTMLYFDLQESHHSSKGTSNYVGIGLRF